MGEAADPYPASWVDRLIDWIDALPGPAWVPYVAIGIVVGLGVHAAAWVDGFVPSGTFDLYLASLAIYIVISVAAVHLLDHVATGAWTTFRQAVSLADDEAARVRYELTTLPARPALAWSIGGIVVALITGLAASEMMIEIETAPLTFLTSMLVAVGAYMTGGVFIYHTIRQLRLIDRLPRYLERIDLLDTGPLHAFSGVTALTGGIFLVAAYFSVLTDPTTLTNPAVAAVNGFSVLLGVACFVLPLSGMQRRIAAEKARRLSNVSHRLDAAIRDLARRNEIGDLSDADAVNKNINSLLAERDLLSRTPTWPWAPETVRGFSSALVLPIVLWLVFRLLERAIV